MSMLSKLAVIISMGGLMTAFVQSVQSQPQVEKTESAGISTSKPSIITTIDLQNQKAQIPWGKVVVIRDPFDGDVTKVFDRQIVATAKSPNAEEAQMFSSENVLVTEWSPTLVKAYVVMSSSTCVPQIAMPNSNSGGSPLDAIGSLSSLTSMASMIPGAESIGMIGGALSMFGGIVGNVLPSEQSAAPSCKSSTTESRIPAQELELKVSSKAFKLTKNKDGFVVSPELSQALRSAQPNSVYVRATLNPEAKDMSPAMGNNLNLSSPIVAEVSPSTITSWRTVYAITK